MLYHPSHHVPSLDVAEDFFGRVFGRPSTRLASVVPGAADYSTFTPIADVLFDCIDPKRYELRDPDTGGKVAPYPLVTQPALKGMGWYVEGIGSLFEALLDAGFEVIDQLDRPSSNGELPTAVGSPMPLFFTTPSSAGLRYEFLPLIPFPLDHRLTEGWTPGVPVDGDPLGLVRCAHHTLVTADPGRALRLFVEVLGGVVTDEGTEQLVRGGEPIELASSRIDIADSTIVLAIDADHLGGGPASDTADTYCSLTWQVGDLDEVHRYLEQAGVAIALRTEDRLITDADTSLGIPWGFTAAS